jgi:hypothetical protein
MLKIGPVPQLHGMPSEIMVIKIEGIDPFLYSGKSGAAKEKPFAKAEALKCSRDLGLERSGSAGPFGFPFPPVVGDGARFFRGLGIEAP